MSTEGEEMPGLLEERFKSYDDSATNGTEWINESGDIVKRRKGGNIPMTSIGKEDVYYCLLPEYYLRPSEASFMSFDQFKEQIKEVQDEIENLLMMIEDE